MLHNISVFKINNLHMILDLAILLWQARDKNQQMHLRRMLRF